MAEAYLPEHIIHQIFLQMPTKPLFRLKCLSKTWNNVISDPKFIKSRSRRMIFLPILPFHVIDNNVTGAPSMIKPVSSLMNIQSYDDITIVGSFNGIVLLVLTYKSIVIDHEDCRHHIILFNPLSGEFKTVPLPQSYDASSYYCYGFGYGTTTDDLKIVSLRGYLALKSYEVFHLKTWSWSTPSELIRDYAPRHHSATFLNGFLYWHVSSTRVHYLRQVIMALDIKNMVFSEIELECSWLYHLGTYNGQLSMICHQQDTREYEYRVMNEHGFGESWFRSSFRSTFKLGHGWLCNFDDGNSKLLLSENSSNKLIIYDIFRDSYTGYVNALSCFDGARRRRSVEYVESLISPSDICSISV